MTQESTTSSGGDVESATQSHSETLTLEVDVPLDEIHTQMWDEITASVKTDGDIKDGLADGLSEQLAESGQVDQMLYQAYQRIQAEKREFVKQQQQQAQNIEFGVQPDETEE